MDDKRPANVTGNGESVVSDEVDRRPLLILAGIGTLVVLVVLVAIVSLTTRSQTSTHSTRFQLLRLDENAVASLPPGGVDGWLFSVDGLGRLTRTDLTTGETFQVSLRDPNEGEPSFAVSRSALVHTDGDVLWAGPHHLYVIDATTLEVRSVEHDMGPAVMVAYDDTTVWLRTFISLGPSSLLFSIDIETLGVGEPFVADPLQSGVIVAGAANGTLRYYAGFGGSWELEQGTHTRIDRAIVAGTNGGTVEIRCGNGPTDCATIIYDIRTGTETVVDADLQTSDALLSPTLDAIVTSSQVIYIDGTVIDLPGSGEWTWSSDGRFITSDELIVVDLGEEPLTFQMPVADRSFEPQEALVVMRLSR